MGDVAGIGPEIIAAGWAAAARPTAAPSSSATPAGCAAPRRSTGADLEMVPVRQVSEVAASAAIVPCLSATSATDLSTVQPGQVTAAGGRAAYDFLCAAIDRTLAGEADGIVTAPLHKEGLHAAGDALSRAHRDPGRAQRRPRLRHGALPGGAGRGSRHPAHGPARRVPPSVVSGSASRRPGCSTACSAACWDGSRVSAWPH